MMSFSRKEEILPEKETISNYLERVEIFFKIRNSIADGKKVPVFLNIAEGNIYTLLHSLLSPAKPQEKSFAKLAAELKKHFELKKIIIAGLFNFHRRSWAPDESIANRLHS